MGIDRDWVTINELVEAGLRDAGIVDSPPRDDEELGFVAEKVTDHLAAALQRGTLVMRAPSERRP